jgi:hypothetical protein
MPRSARNFVNGAEWGHAAYNTAAVSRAPPRGVSTVRKHTPCNYLLPG